MTLAGPLIRRHPDDLAFRRHTAMEDETGDDVSIRSLKSYPIKKEEDLSPQDRQQQSTSVNEDSKDQICICTPAPKIPRPRNAFILYRQHHQSQVTADNPRLSNPEISKIIGSKWKGEQEDVKEYWKRLAEEEKQRHQLQYPDYRYQPRRGQRGLATRIGTALPDDQERCKKCGGRLIATPRTPSGTYATSAPSDSETEPRSHPGNDRMDLDHPGTQRSYFPGQSTQGRHDASGSNSPDMKRQRLSVPGEYHHVKLPSLHPPGPESRHANENWRPRSEETPRSIRSPFDEMATLPELRSLPHPGGSHMPPPPRPPTISSEPDRHISPDHGVRLPPLQTALSAASISRIDFANFGKLAMHSPFPPQTRESNLSAHEMQIMALSFKRKLGVLARIIPVIPIRSRESLRQPTRGAFVAVEGPESGLLREVGRIVENGLRSMEGNLVRLWSGDAGRNASGRRTLPPVKSEVQAKESLPSQEGGFADNFPSNYFQTILEWREKCKEITAFVTQTPEASSASTPRLPVALIKDGFNLTLCDRFASSIPINDEYQVGDHWQWMATLWRGTLSADLVVYVKPSGDDEIRQVGGVELDKKSGLMVVRIPWGKGADEATERRILFELTEWIGEGSYLEPSICRNRQDNV